MVARIVTSTTINIINKLPQAAQQMMRYTILSGSLHPPVCILLIFVRSWASNAAHSRGPTRSSSAEHVPVVCRSVAGCCSRRFVRSRPHV
jgi:hypothetical protein